MNKLIWALALVLTPFFSVKAQVSNIFEDGTVITEEPKLETIYTYECTTNTGVRVSGDFSANTDNKSAWIKSCVSAGQTRAESLEADSICTKKEISHVFEESFLKFTVVRSKFRNNQCIDYESYQIYFTRQLDESQGKTCPPDGKQTFTYPHMKDGDIDSCSDPVQIGLVDDCKVNSRDFLSRTRVTSQSVCTTLPNGSICKYDAVNVGGGQQVYDLDLEGDCYAKNNDLPKSDYTNDSKPLPGVGETGYACLEDGGLLTCSEEKEDVTDPNTGEVQEGCGTANIVFICMSGDTDSDGLPDYLDPDIDGDGVPNEDDLDSDGDGKDDPIDNNGSGNNQSGGGGEPTDLSPVVNKLEQIRQQDEDNYKKFHETSVDLIDKPTDEAVSFYESEYEDGLEGIWNDTKTDFENTEMMTFLNTFKDIPTGGSAINGNMCFNLGAMGNFGCGDLAANPIVWGAIRIFILVCAGFLCRALIFGG